MNYKSKYKHIEKLLRLHTRKNSKGKNTPTYHKGVYVYSRGLNDTTFKIGMAWGGGGIKNRMDSYKICYPSSNELFLQMCVISFTQAGAKFLEKVILKDKRFDEMEAILVDGAKSRVPREYRVVTKRVTLYDAVSSALNDYPNLWSYVVVFGKDSWRIHANDGHSVKGLYRPSNNRTVKPSLTGGVIEPLKKPTKKSVKQVSDFDEKDALKRAITRSLSDKKMVSRSERLARRRAKKT